MVTIKVKGGTPHSNEFLCRTCNYAQSMRGLRTSEERILCGGFYPAREISFAVTECTLYEDRRLPSRRDMEKIAWILLTKKPGRSIGFISAARFRELEGDDAEDIPNVTVNDKSDRDE